MDEQINQAKPNQTIETQKSGPTISVTQPPVVRAIREKSLIVHRQKFR